MDEKSLLLKPVRSLYPEEEWARIRAQDLSQKGMQHHMDTRMIKGNGEILEVDLSLCVLRGADGEVAGSLRVMKDLDGRKKAQKQLQMAEDKCRTIFENSAVAITATDEDQNIVAWPQVEQH